MIRNDKSKFINHCGKKERMLENVSRRNERRFVKDKALDRDDLLAKTDFKCSGVVVLKDISRRSRAYGMYLPDRCRHLSRS